MAEIKTYHKKNGEHLRLTIDCSYGEIAISYPFNDADKSIVKGKFYFFEGGRRKDMSKLFNELIAKDKAEYKRFAACLMV